MNPFFTDYSEYIKRFFPETKIQKISVNTGNTCPNRDGTLGKGGCIYCDNRSFTPSYCFSSESVVSQIEKGKAFFGRKYKDMKYLAYFQSYTTTYINGNSPVAGNLADIFHEVLECEDVVGLVIGTRPDCIGDDTIDLIRPFNNKYPIFVELGIESMHDDTLRLINRGHDSKTSENTIARLRDNGFHVGAHIIAGLPGETEEMMLDTVSRLCYLGVESIKLHHLQILKNTTLHKMWERKEIKIQECSLESYLDFCIKVISRVPRSVAIERFLASSPPELVVAPKWGIKNYEFTNLLLKRLKNNVSK